MLCFAAGTLAAAAFAVAYVLDWGNEAYGASLGVAFCCLALGLALWSKIIDAQEPDYVEPREVGPSPEPEFGDFVKALTEQPVPRSGFLWGMFGISVAAIGTAALFPLRSLFSSWHSPADILEHSPWSSGRHAVTEEGEFVKADDLTDGSILTVFPEGWDVRQSAGATLLIRVAADALELPASRRGWTVDGVIAYSKLCSHAGCPVGLYADEAHQLLCPCHHSIFDVLDGAQPVEGPASHPLPQLPLGTDADGFLIATGPFSGPVGAAWWGPR
jgi:ubiquinol-cytochrome c reductase iron-sulfur subunit